ncbi:MAG TPA: peptidoglycan recognition family protein [bacterium]
MNADYPGAIVWPAHESNHLGPPCVIKGLILHTPEETADAHPGTPLYFAQPDKSASTQYFASYLGFIWQMVPENVAAIANGVLGKPYPAWANPGQSLNRQTTNIEIEGRAASIAQTMPRGSGQWKAVVNWCAYICKKYGIPADRAHIIGHYEVANNRSDPGTLDIGAIVADVQAKLAEEETMSSQEYKELRAAVDVLQKKAAANVEFVQFEGFPQVYRVSGHTLEHAKDLAAFDAQSDFAEVRLLKKGSADYVTFARFNASFASLPREVGGL